MVQIKARIVSMDIEETPSPEHPMAGNVLYRLAYKLVKDSVDYYERSVRYRNLNNKFEIHEKIPVDVTMSDNFDVHVKLGVDRHEDFDGPIDSEFFDGDESRYWNNLQANAGEIANARSWTPEPEEDKPWPQPKNSQWYRRWL